MKAMILAAGLGTRLRPLTEETPKALLIVGGRPLIHYQIALLKHYGVTEIAINLHHLGELIEKELGDGKRLGVSITYSREEEILGTGGGIRKMTPFFEGKEFWVMNSDILIDANLKTIAQYHRKRKAKATMVLRPHPSTTGEEMNPTVFYRNKEGHIIAARESVDKSIQEVPMMFTGLHLLHPSLLEHLPNTPSCIFRDAYLPAMQKGESISGYSYDGYWMDLGTIEQYRQADRDISGRRVNLSYL